MSYLTQKTLKDKVQFSGIGLHSGETIDVCIKPAQPDFGIVFEALMAAIFKVLESARLSSGSSGRLPSRGRRAAPCPPQ